MTEEIVVRVDGASKKFCRNLRRSLWYGIQDSFSDLIGRGGDDELRSDEFWAVHDVSFQLKRGECIGLIGHNGAGKTTLLKMLSGLIKPDRGRIEVRGRLGALIALGAGFNPVLTGRENVYVNGAVLGLSKKEIDSKYEEIVDFADIGDFINAPVQSYSSGMQVRLGFAVAAATRPDILLLDEVLAVGDQNFQAKCFNTLARFRKEGTSFILVAHNMHLIARHCQSILYLRHGRPVHVGDVGLGLEHFAREMADKKGGPAVDATSWDAACGSGAIRLTQARFLDAKGCEISTMRVGDHLTVVLRYERLDPSVREVKLDFVIRDGERVVFQGDNVSAGRPFEVRQSKGAFVIKFEYVPWNAPRLDFAVALLDPASNEIYDWKEDFRLSLESRIFNQGSVYLPAEWHIESDAIGSQFSAHEKSA